MTSQLTLKPKKTGRLLARSTKPCFYPIERLKPTTKPARTIFLRTLAFAKAHNTTGRLKCQVDQSDV